MVAGAVPGDAVGQGRVSGIGRVFAIVCALMLVAGCAAGVSRTPSPASTSGDTAMTTPPTSSATTTVEVGDRSMLLYVPASRRSSAPAALVVVLHGYTGEAAGAVEFFGLRPLADQRGFLVAAPQGTVDSEGRTFWNASNACCNFHGSQVDDSGFLSQVIASVVASHAVDPARVYVVGHSNGGFMAHRLACEHADQVAAIASLAGAMDADAECEPSKPVSVVQVHGEADDSILYDGGELNGKLYTSAVETVARWRRADRCTGDGRPGAPLDADAEVTGEDLTPTAWDGCRGDTEVALWTIADSGHVPVLTPAFSTALMDWLEAHSRRT